MKRRFADAPLPAELDDAELSGAAELVEQRVSTGRLEFGGFGRAGFVGECVYRLHGPPERRRALSALADYAFFCGTGVKTALGMGQTRPRVPRERPTSR